MFCTQESAFESKLEYLFEVVNAEIFERAEALHIRLEVSGDAGLQEVVQLLIEGRKFISNYQLTPHRNHRLLSEIIGRK